MLDRKRENLRISLASIVTLPLLLSVRGLPPQTSTAERPEVE